MRLPVLALVASAAALSAFAHGGWSVISVRDVPDRLLVAQPVDLQFTIRQHGMDRQGGLKPTVTVRGQGDPVTVAAVPTGKTGDYRATITAPAAGEWSININSGFGRSRLSLLPTVAVAPGAVGSAVPEVARGKRLFVAKGCIVCHVHPQVTDTGNESIPVGPPLGARTLDASAIASILTNGVNPGKGPKMPNLELRPAEVAALTTFLTGGQQAAAVPAP